MLHTHQRNAEYSKHSAFCQAFRPTRAICLSFSHSQHTESSRLARFFPLSAAAFSLRLLFYLLFTALIITLHLEQKKNIWENEERKENRSCLRCTKFNLPSNLNSNRLFMNIQLVYAISLTTR